MMNNDTPASATGAAGVKKQVLFGSTSVSNTSATFSAGPEPMYIRAFNLNVGDTITVQAVGGTGSGSAFAAFAPLGSPIVLTPGTPQVRLDWPGQYRLVFSGVSVTSILCEGYLAASSEPTIYTQGTGGGGGGGFAFVASDTPSVDLTFTGTSAGGTLTADVKRSASVGNIITQNVDGLFANVVIQTAGLINISGLGTAGSPYIISNTLAVLPYPNLAAQPDGLISNAGFGTIIYMVDNPFQICDIFGGERSTNSQGETCVGYSAGAATLGFFKTCIGNSALANATTAATGDFIGQVAVGYRAGLGCSKNTLLSTASVFVGQDAGNGCTFSSATLVGRSAGANYSGNHLVAIGDAAASGLTGTDNTVIGNSAAAGSLTTNNSVIIGDISAQGIAAGDYVISIGSGAGEAATPGAGNNDGCIFIGAKAGSHNAFADAIIIGSGPSALNTTQAHQILLGTASHTQLRTAGSIIAGGAISPSDARLKDNVATIGNALEVVDKLRPVYFHWDQQALENAKLPHRAVDCGKNTSGFIAQEINEIIPEVVDVMMGGDGIAYNYVHYDRLIGLAFAAVKELSAQNKALRADIEALKAKGT